jgi:5-methylcytosine-specific restriction protein A
MEKRVDSIVFRRMTHNDFDKINQQGSVYQAEEGQAGGGGQGYIDFPTRNISIEQWNHLLGDPTSRGAQNRPKWTINTNSLGLEDRQEILISNRRNSSVSITSQKLPEASTSGNRIFSWHPNNSFPINYNPAADNLIVYIIKADDETFWAGWFLENEAPRNWVLNDELRPLFVEESAGIIIPTVRTLFDTEIKKWPFYFDAQTIQNKIKTDEDIEEDLLNQDISPKLSDIENEPIEPEVKARILKIRKRNKKIVRELKNLYQGKCQITGDTMTFRKRDGELYSEVHHLIPLGEQGSDSYANAIVISPLIHRMLHYATVSEIDLNKIEDSKLKITINDDEYEITWLPEHLATVENSLDD